MFDIYLMFSAIIIFVATLSLTLIVISRYNHSSEAVHDDHFEDEDLNVTLINNSNFISEADFK